MQVHPIEALRDNYIWMMQDRHGHALVVDPGEAEPVFREIEQQQLTLTDILLTHHHPDHIGGSAELAEACGARIVAPHDERITAADVRVDDGDMVHAEAPDWRFNVLAVPGHTRSHVAYFGEGLLFSGDTLFSLGCGRLFEGSATQMLESLDRLAQLPPDTELCCGHEYTLDNAAFAQSVDPDNEALNERLRQARQLRQSGRATVPVALADELESNPFLRVDSPELIAWATQQGVPDDRVRRFAALRTRKDHFSA